MANDSEEIEGRRPNPRDSTRGVDLFALLAVLKSRFVLLSAIAICGTASGVAWAIFGQKTYEVEILVAPVEEDLASNSALAQVGSLANIIGLGANQSLSRREEALALLTSRAFLMRFIDEKGLMSRLFPRESEDSWLNTIREPDVPTLQDAYRRFTNDVLSITEIRGSRLIEIKLRWSDPETPATWGEQLVDDLNRSMQMDAQQRAQRSLEFLQQELGRTEVVEVRQAIFRLIQNELQSVMLANVADEFAMRVIDPPIPPDPDRPVSFSGLQKVLLCLILFVFLGGVTILARNFNHFIRL